MKITQTFTMTRTEVTAYRETATQAITLIKPLLAELVGDDFADAKGDLLIERLKGSVSLDVEVANKLSSVAYLLRVSDDVEVNLTIDIDDVVFTELMAYGVDLLNDYMGVLTSLATLGKNLKDLVASNDLPSTKRLEALKARMGDDKVSVVVDGDDLTAEDATAPYPYWSITEGGVIKDVADIGIDSDITDIEATLIELSLSLPKKTFLLQASARTRLVVENGEILKAFKFEDFYIMDDDHKREAEIFNNLIPASHDGMGNFKTK